MSRQKTFTKSTLDQTTTLNPNQTQTIKLLPSDLPHGNSDLDIPEVASIGSAKIEGDKFAISNLAT